MIKLIINGSEVDIDREESKVLLNKKFSALENPVDYYCDYSKTIKLPMTDNNKIIFSQLNRQDSVVTNHTIDARKRIDFVLLNNGELAMTGYCKLVNANNIVSEGKFEIELYSTFGYVMNELKSLTFNPNTAEEDKYLIESPFNEIIDRTLVKRAFETDEHRIDGDDILDYMTFVPSYQGMYEDFESNKFQYTPTKFSDMDFERDEHYVREFRSYYQQPALWVNKLWKIAKDKLQDITDYQLVLDESWFNSGNPYWTDLLYTCPSLYTSDDDFVEKSVMLNDENPVYSVNINRSSDLSTEHTKKIFLQSNKIDAGFNYDNSGVFNPDKNGYTELSARVRLMMLTNIDDGVITERLGRLSYSNPLFVKFQAVDAETNMPIKNAEYTYLCYSNSTRWSTTSGYDEMIDFGSFDVYRNDVLDGNYPAGYQKSDGIWFSKDVDLKLTVGINTSYYVTCNMYFANNSNPSVVYGINDVPFPFYGCTLLSGMSNVECKTINYLRSFSELDMYRVFPKDIELSKVLLNYSKIFGLIWTVDEFEKTITVMNKNKYFSDDITLDWTNKVDMSRDFVLEPVTFGKKYVAFNVEDGEIDKLKGYQKRYDAGYGERKLNTGWEFDDDTEELYEGIMPSVISQKKQRSRLVNTEYEDKPDFMGYNYKIYPEERYIDNDSDGDSAGMYGAFYFRDGTFAPDERLSAYHINGEPIVSITDDTRKQFIDETFCWNLTDECNISTNVIPNISTVKDGYSIHFTQPKEYFYKGDITDYQYVYDLFWKDYIDERYSVQNKKLIGYFYLTNDDYINFDFNKFIKIDNCLYAVNQISDFDITSNDATKVELVQVWDRDAYRKQKQFGYIFTDKTTYSIAKEEKEIFVTSYGDWYVKSAPSWMIYTTDSEKIIYKAATDSVKPRTGKMVLENEFGLSCIVYITQYSLFPYLRLSTYSISAKAAGDTIVVDVDADPTSVRVTSKPEWVDVVVNGTHIKIDVEFNRNPFNRNGLITFTNGSKNATLSISQLGNVVSTDVGTLNFTEPTIVNIYTPIEVDTGSVSNNAGNASIINSARINDLQLYIEPSTSSNGGIVTVNQLDGSSITVNYNYGEVTDRKQVIVNSIKPITVNGTEYSGTYHSTEIAGSIVDVSATDDSFVQWSDGITTRTRSITVDSNVTITAIYE